MNLAEFEAELTEALVDELTKWEPRLEAEEMRVFDVGCFPWFGTIELSFLTMREEALVIAHPGEEIATWRLYGFSGRDAGLWSRGQKLLDWLDHRRRSEDDRYANEALWQASASAVGSARVEAALARYTRAPGFFCTVFNPDDPAMMNYLTGEPVDWSRLDR